VLYNKFKELFKDIAKRKNMQNVQEWMVNTVQSEKLVVGYKICSACYSKLPVPKKYNKESDSNLEESDPHER